MGLEPGYKRHGCYPAGALGIFWSLLAPSQEGAHSPSKDILDMRVPCSSGQRKQARVLTGLGTWLLQQCQNVWACASYYNIFDVFIDSLTTSRTTCVN